MRTFNVLDRNLDIHRNYLLEASAGTGKTFSIENIIVRLLIEKEALLLEELLVVTFTRAAVRDLKVRIRTNIEKCLNYLILGGAESTPDYIRKICEEGPNAVEGARRRLERALLSYDQAQIFTIHSFCARMLNEHVLEGDLRVNSISGEEPLPDKVVLGMIRDYIRTEIRPEIFSHAQLSLLLKEQGYSIEQLESGLLEHIKQNADIEQSLSYDKLLDSFKGKMAVFKRGQNLSSQKILTEFAQFAHCFKKLTNLPKKYDAQDSLQRFAALFDKEDWKIEDLEWLIRDQLLFIKGINAENLKVRAKLPSGMEQFIELCRHLYDELRPLVCGTRILSRMAYDCRKFVQNRLKQEEILGFNNILEAMRKAVDNSRFVDLIRSQYRAALIDEFQDTDPLQWEIFRKLFLRSGYLYLVGDPKQSIYAFRQADIYTYLNAAEAIGNHASLDTNYRSQSNLVDAMNVLFEKASSDGLFDLPRINRAIDYRKVKAAPANVGEGKSIQFFTVETDRKGSFPLQELELEHFFPFMAQEILKLKGSGQFNFNECAVLVADRYQAKRLAAYFNGLNIPILTQRGRGVADSSAMQSLKELLKGVLDSRKGTSLKLALGGQIIQWTHHQIRSLEQPDAAALAVNRFCGLRRILLAKGFSAFYEALMASSWHEDGSTVIERLLKQESGLEFLNDLQTLVDYVLEYECHHSLSVDSLIDYLDNFQAHHPDGEQTASPCDVDYEAVNILTLHASKGLEFSYVFTLGLINQKRKHSSLDSNSERFQELCKEINAEKLRLLYVAMTRAKKRLYCPVVFATNRKYSDEEASPMDLFVEKLKLPRHDCISFRDLIHQLGANMNCVQLDQLNIKLEPWGKSKHTDLLDRPPSIVNIPGEPKSVRSFSTLFHVSGIRPVFGNEASPQDFQASRKTPHTLPAGSETGNILHKLFEKIPFADAGSALSPADLLSFVRTFTHKTAFADWDNVLCEILYNTFKTPFLEGKYLASVDPEAIYREAEFLYPRSFGIENGYLKGFVDLFFEHEGKYYLLDWKSNWLGRNFQSYTAEKMEKEMDENHYHKQAAMYKDAVKKYLFLVEKRPFEEVFGGIYYVFLRGVQIDQGNQFGVYHFR